MKKIDYSKVVELDNLAYLCDEQHYLEAMEECILRKDFESLVEITEIHLFALQQRNLMEQGLEPDASFKMPHIDKSTFCTSLENAI